MWHIVPENDKVESLEGIELYNGEQIKQIKSKGYEYFGILELNEIVEKAIKEQLKMKYFRRLRSMLRSKLTGQNKIPAVKTWEIAPLWYEAGIIK